MGPYSFYCAGYAGLAFDGNYANEENYTAYAVGVADGKSQHYLKSRAALLEEVAQQLAAPQAAEVLAKLGSGEAVALPGV